VGVLLRYEFDRCPWTSGHRRTWHGRARVRSAPYPLMHSCAGGRLAACKYTRR